jgi:DNA-directed RNA polymerase subunit RPC12/RpoP
MNTIEFTCGYCGQSFAISPEQIGQQVECPHCQLMISLDALAPQDSTQRPEGTVFDPLASAEGAAPSLEQPSPAIAAPEHQVESAAPAHALDLSAPAASALAATPTVPPLVVPQPRKRSQVVPMVLIFLIPYSLVTTGVIAYLLWKQSQRSEQNPLEMMLDQNPGDGGPKQQIKHDLPLQDRQKSSLNQPFRVDGFVEVTALSVELLPPGDQLTLTLRFRNLSEDLEFDPLPQSFLVLDKGYTFLEFGQHRIYGGKLVWQKPAAKAPAKTSPGLLSPGETRIATLSTLPKGIHTAKVKEIANYRGPLLWRLEIRRGLVEMSGQTVSTTMVIGVEFDAALVLADQVVDAQAKPAGAQMPAIAWTPSATIFLSEMRLAAKSR